MTFFPPLIPARNRNSAWTLATGFALIPSIAIAADPGPTTPDWSQTRVDVTGYYLMTEFDSDPAFSRIGRITGTADAIVHGTTTGLDNYSLNYRGPRLYGGGVRASLQHMLDATWFVGGSYSGFFTQNRSSLGDPAVDTDQVHANMLDRTFADNNALNSGFDDGLVDYATEKISMSTNFGDLVFGRRFGGRGVVNGFWQGGVRVGTNRVERDITYKNLEPFSPFSSVFPDARDSAYIEIDSVMYGIGPTIGGGFEFNVFPGITVSTQSSLSALYSYFDLARADQYEDENLSRQSISSLSLESSGLVPVFDASIGLSARRGAFFASLGYTASAWLGGSRTITTPGWDDVDDETSVYRVRDDNLITHGVFARAGVVFGDDPEDYDAAIFGSSQPWTSTTIDITGYYLMTAYGGSPAFGRTERLERDADDGLTPPSPKLSRHSNNAEVDVPVTKGGGIRARLRHQFDPDWFVGGDYSGFFTHQNSSLGDLSEDHDTVLAALLDRTLANNASLSDDFRSGQVDLAKESIEIDQHFGDLVFGRRFAGGRLSGYWLGGLRLANAAVDRDVLYQNNEPTLIIVGGNVIERTQNGFYDRAEIELRSEMWGLGPTFGGGATLPVYGGLSLQTSAAVSALYADFDLSRRDTYIDASQSSAEIREISAESRSIVPVVDASLELNHRHGRYFAGVGYTLSAWLGGAREIATPGWDDVDDDTSVYTIESADLITHGFHARAGVMFGDGIDEQEVASFASASLWSNVSASLTGYVLSSSLGGMPAFSDRNHLQPESEFGVFDLNIQRNSYRAFGESPYHLGGGIAADIRSGDRDGWFQEIGYTGIFTQISTSDGVINDTTSTSVQQDGVGEPGDNDDIIANFINRTYADNNSLNDDFDAGLVDYASDEIHITQNMVDLSVGNQRQALSNVSAFWTGGVRFGMSDIDRDVYYFNHERLLVPLDGGGTANVGDNDWAKIALNSTMYGVGPMVGGGAAWTIGGTGFVVSAKGSVAGLVSYFQLDRSDTYYNASIDRDLKARYDTETYGLVPVVDLEVGISREWGRLAVELGYMANGWFGGSRRLATPGWDDVDDEVTSYTVESEDIINHGGFARLSYSFYDEE